MEMDEFNKLEDKIKKLVVKLKQLTGENQTLKEKLAGFKNQSSSYDQERSDIKKKVSHLIDLIESIEK